MDRVYRRLITALLKKVRSEKTLREIYLFIKARI